MSKFELPIFPIEDLRDLPVNEVFAAYWGALNGQNAYDWRHPDDFLLVEEVVSAAHRITKIPLVDCEGTVGEVLGDRMEEACEVAKFRSELRARRERNARWFPPERQMANNPPRT